MEVLFFVYLGLQLGFVLFLLHVEMEDGKKSYIANQVEELFVNFA